MESKKYAPEYTDREIIDMLAEIFGVGIGDYSYRDSAERA